MNVNAFHWSLIAVVVVLLLAAFMRRRSYSPLQCPKCNSTNNCLTYGDFYDNCPECAWDEYAKHTAAKKHPSN